LWYHLKSRKRQALPAISQNVISVFPYPVFLSRGEHEAAQQRYLKEVGNIMDESSVLIRGLDAAVVKRLNTKAKQMHLSRNELIIQILENAVSHDLFAATEEKYQALSNHYMQAFEQVVKDNTQALRRNTDTDLQVLKLLDGVFDDDGDAETEE